MKNIFLILSLSLLSFKAFPCTTCNKPLQEAIYDSSFYPNLLVMLSAFLVLAVLVILLAMLSARRHRSLLLRHPQQPRANPVPLTTASMILGIGLGGFLDGILLHQVTMARNALE